LPNLTGFKRHKSSLKSMSGFSETTFENLSFRYSYRQAYIHRRPPSHYVPRRTMAHIA
jgi:hypothetical protein